MRHQRRSPIAIPEVDMGPATRSGSGLLDEAAMVDEESGCVVRLLDSKPLPQLEVQSGEVHAGADRAQHVSVVATVEFDGAQLAFR